MALSEDILKLKDVFNGANPLQAGMDKGGGTLQLPNVQDIQAPQVAGATPTPNAPAPSPTIDPSSRIPQDMQERIAGLNEVFARPNLVQNGSLATPAPSGAEFDFSGLPNVSDTGLSEEAFGRLSPTAQGSIIDVPTDTGILFTPTLQGMGAGGGQIAPEGMAPTIGPDGRAVFSDSRTAQDFTEAELATQREDKAAQQRFLASPEAQEFSSRQLRSAIMGDGQFGRESVAREQRAAEGFGQARGPDSRDSDRGGAMSKADAVKLTGGDRAAADALLKRQELGLGEFAPEKDTRSPEQIEQEQLANERTRQIIEAGQKPTAGQEKIGLIRAANPNISDEDAAAIASGSVKVVQNPLTGETQLLNVATGRSKTVSGGKATGVNFDVSTPEKTLFSRAGDFTGAVEAVKRKAQGLTGQVGLDVATDESLEAAQDFETAQNELVRAFRESDRYSATEANQLKKELNISLSPFEDPKSAESKLRSIDKSLARRYENELATYQDASFPSSDRQDALLRARAIAEFRATLGVPDSGDQVKDGAGVPPGIDPQDWEYMDEEQRKLFK